MKQSIARKFMFLYYIYSFYHIIFRPFSWIKIIRRQKLNIKTTTRLYIPVYKEDQKIALITKIYYFIKMIYLVQDIAIHTKNKPLSNGKQKKKYVKLKTFSWLKTNQFVNIQDVENKIQFRLDLNKTNLVQSISFNLMLRYGSSSVLM